MVAHRIVQVVNEHGLHTRPASLFVDLACGFASIVWVRNLTRDGERLDGKSAMSVILLNAPKGTELEIAAEGPDADDAVNSLASLVNSGFRETNAL